ncbi:MAG: SDR family NAD(P)-dependent oxidoreductase [Pseudomonadota bacterium]
MIKIESFEGEIDAAVIGASGGIGRAMTQLLLGAPGICTVHALSRRGRVAGLSGDVSKLSTHALDLSVEGSIDGAMAALAAKRMPRLMVVATGLLHDGQRLRPEKNWRDLDPAALAESYAINTIGPALVAKHAFPRFPRRERAIFGVISARVGSIADNQAGGWYGYRASKAALNQILKCLAIEATRSRPQLVVAGLQPGTVATPLSAPFRSGVRAQDLFAPEEAAGHLLGVLDRLQPEHSGRLFDWRGEEFPP